MTTAHIIAKGAMDQKGPAIGGYKDSTDVYSQGKRKRDEAMIHSNSKRPKLAEPAGRRYS